MRPLAIFGQITLKEIKKDFIHQYLGIILAFSALYVISIVYVEFIFILDLFPLVFFKLCAGSSSAGGSPGGSTGGHGSMSNQGEWGGGSTPFLMTWNGDAYETENDVLVGYPSSSYFSYEEGLRAYETGKIQQGDLYKLRNTFKDEHNKIKFQIKEIEPEESFFDTLAFEYMTYPKTAIPIVDSKFRHHSLFDREKVSKGEGVLKQHISYKGSSIDDQMISITTLNDDKGIKKGNFTLETWDEVYMECHVENRQDSLFLLLGSNFRDWTPGTVLANKPDTIEKVASPYSSSTQNPWIRSISRVSAVALVVGIGFFGDMYTRVAESLGIGGKKDTSELTTLKNLANSFGPRDAIASTCSFLLQYWDGEVYVEFDIVSPREHQVSLSAIEIPTDAINSEGLAKLRIVATKKHTLAGATFVSGKAITEKVRTETLSVSKAYLPRTQADYSKTLREKYNGEYVHLRPLDVLEVEVEAPEKNLSVLGSEYEEAYFLRAEGFYIPLREETKHGLGVNWPEKLSEHDQARLKALYVKDDYYLKERTTVLS